MPPILATLGGVFVWNLFQRTRAQLRATRDVRLLARLRQLAATLEQELVLLAMTVLGAGLFVYWQAGPALLPNNNATVKFIYVASLFPPALALLFSRGLKPLPFNLLSSYFLVLFIAAFPFAMYWPR